MKNTMKISGLIAPILLAFGALSKIQHWPWAGVLLVTGFFLLSFIFLPSAIYVNYKEVSNFTKKWTHIAGFLGTFFLSVGFLFKVQHWPGAGLVITIGILLICLVFLPMVLLNRLKDQNDSVPAFVYFSAFAGFMLSLIGFLFKVMHWPFAMGLLFAGCVLLFFVAFPLYVYHMYKDHQYVATSFVFIVIVLVWYVVPTTLISLNFSRDILNNVDEANQSMNRDLEFIQESNNAILADIKDPQFALIINEKAGELNAYIEEMKKGINKNEMPDSIEMAQLTALMNGFENKLLSFAHEEKYRSMISRTLRDPLMSKMQFHNDPEFCLHHLIFLQLSIRLAEQTSLRHLYLTERDTLQALNQ